MEERKIKCYLCGNESIQKEGYDTSRNVRVNCQKCMKYELSGMVIKFYLKRENGKELLKQDDKEKLSEYVQKHYDSVKRTPVFLDTKIVETITGKISIHER